MKSLKVAVLFTGALCLAACSTYRAKPQLHYYHGDNVPEGYITILRASIFSEHTPDQVDRLLGELKRLA